MKKWALLLLLACASCRDVDADGFVRVVLTGDSNTLGYGVAPGETDAAQLAGLLMGLTDPTGAAYDVSVQASNGCGAMDACATQHVADALAAHADCVVLAFGSADIIKDYGFGGGEPGLRPNEAILAAITSLRATLLAAGRLPIGATVPRIIDPDEVLQNELDARVTSLNASIRTLFAFDVAYDLVTYPDDYLDPWHMNADGHAVRAAEVFGILRYGL